MNSIYGDEHRVVLPEAANDSIWLDWGDLGGPPEYCLFCGFPFGTDLRLADPLRVVIPRAAERIESLEGPVHLYCIYKFTRR